MDISQIIARIEALVRDKGSSIDEFCARSRIDRATWQRWKARKTKPSFDAWLRVTTELSALESAPSPPAETSEAA